MRHLRTCFWGCMWGVLASGTVMAEEATVQGRTFSITPAEPTVVIMANEVAPFLDRTSWRLYRLQDAAPMTLGPDKAAWLYLNDGKLDGYSGCNPITGAYRSRKDTLVFLKVAGSANVCVPLREQEKRFFQMMQATRNWRIDEQKPFHLQLKDKTGKTLAEFEPVPGNPLR